MWSRAPTNASDMDASRRVPSRVVLEFDGAPGLHDAIRSKREVNGLIGGPFGEAFPAVDLSHGDLARRQQRPEQHGGGLRAGQHGLRFDPALELLMQAFDGVRRSDGFPLALREAREGEEFVAGLSATARHFNRHLRMNALGPVRISVYGLSC